MKLLIDENLSRKLAARVSDLFPDSIHVTDVVLSESPDAAVWEYAKTNGFTIQPPTPISSNWRQPLGLLRRPLWLRRWTHPTRDAEIVLRREAIRIAQFEIDPEFGLLVIDKE